MSTSNAEDRPGTPGATGPVREVPVDWEALEDAFENNAPEVHSYLHLTTGEVLRVVDGVADPQMHVRIASDGNYLRIDPVSSREQYRWMERFIPMVDDNDLRGKLTQAIDGKGAFRRFKDVLMSFATERERWFAFRSERLRTFMEAWLSAHAIKAIARPAWAEVPAAPESEVGTRFHGRSAQVAEREAHAQRRHAASAPARAVRVPRPARPRHDRGLRRVPEGEARGAWVRAPSRAHAPGARCSARSPRPRARSSTTTTKRRRRSLDGHTRALVAVLVLSAPVTVDRVSVRFYSPETGGAEHPALRARAEARVRGAPRGS